MAIQKELIETKNLVVKCDGGGGPIGHPTIYLNLGKEEKIICPYCSRCYIYGAEASIFFTENC